MDAADDRGETTGARTVWPIVLLFVASRLALAVVGLLAQILIQPHSTFINVWRLSPKPSLAMWGVWDAGWYNSIATNGYDLHPNQMGWANWAFFPAFPLISAGLSHLTRLPTFEAMLVVANLSFLAALFLIHREAEDAFDPATARAAVVLFCAVPGSYVFSSAYTESLFLLAIAATLVLVRRRLWLVAGACAALATLTRNLGIGLLLPLAWAGLPVLWRALRGETAWGEAARVAAALLMPVLALAAFAGFLYWRTGDALAFVTIQRAWGRSLGNPLAAPWAGLLHRDQLPDKDLVSFAFAWLALALLAVLAFLRRWSMLLLAAFLVLAPLAAGLASFQRYALVALPLFLAGAWLVSRRPAALASVVVAFAVLNGFMMTAWALGLGAAA